MCLVMIGWQASDNYPLVIAANRDEAFERPSAAIDWWPGEPALLAGRDLLAGGTWLGINRTGRFGIITNVREFGQVPALRSRGELIRMWLSDGLSAARFQKQLEQHESAYAGFNLLFGDLDSLHYFSNRDTRSGLLQPGCYALSNAALDTPWPKVERARAHLQSVIRTAQPTPEAFMPFLRDRTPAPDDSLPKGPLSLQRRRLLSAPFIVGEDYGTRCSTVITVDRNARGIAHEQHYAPLGELTDTFAINFSVGSAD